MWYAALDRKMAQAEKDPENSGLKKIISFFQTISKCPTTCSNYIQMSHHLFARNFPWSPCQVSCSGWVEQEASVSESNLSGHTCIYVVLPFRFDLLKEFICDETMQGAYVYTTYHYYSCFFLLDLFPTL